MSPCFEPSPCYRQPIEQPPYTNTIPYLSNPNVPTYPLPVISPGGYPTGAPAGPVYGPLPAPQPVQAMPAIPSEAEVPVQTLTGTQFLPGFLRTQIGRRVRVDFLIGTNTLTDRSGTLLAVGASYILLREQETDDLLVCDLYSIKFVTIYY